MGGGPGWGQDWVSVNSRLMSEREAEDQHAMLSHRREAGAGHHTYTRGKNQERKLRKGGTDNWRLNELFLKALCCFCVIAWVKIFPNAAFVDLFSWQTPDFYSHPLPCVWAFVWMSVSSRGWGLGLVMNIVFSENASVITSKYKSN